MGLGVVDEHVRAELSLADLNRLRPAFLRENGTVTAGNASSINDGAAALVLANERSAHEAGGEPLGRLVAYAHAAVDPKVMGLGPIPAVERVLARVKLARHRVQRGVRCAGLCGVAGA